MVPSRQSPEVPRNCFSESHEIHKHTRRDQHRRVVLKAENKSTTLLFYIILWNWKRHSNWIYSIIFTLHVRKVHNHLYFHTGFSPAQRRPRDEIRNPHSFKVSAYTYLNKTSLCDTNLSSLFLQMHSPIISLISGSVTFSKLAGFIP